MASMLPSSVTKNKELSSMRMLSKLLAVPAIAFALFAAVAGAAASPAAPQADSEYVVLKTPQPSNAGKKVEVIEFFAYYCPHCNAWDGKLAEWVKKQGDNIVFKRVHVSRDANVQPQQKLFFTLEAMGLLEQYHSKVFHAMHEEHNRLNRDELVFEWVEKNGIDKKKFVDIYNSPFGVPASLRRTDAMMAAYQIDSWPMIAIDGKYLTSPYQANKNSAAQLTESQQQDNAQLVMDFLLAKAKAEKK
jgi:thiol:disulfide interchange protein DsbA